LPSLSSCSSSPSTASSSPQVVFTSFDLESFVL
jgi:hypothetical protein